MANLTSSNLFCRKQAAEYIGVKPSTLDVWASTRRYGLTYIKVGRLAKYRKEDLDAFLESRTVNVSNQEEN